MDEYAKEWVMKATKEQQRVYQHFMEMLQGTTIIKKALLYHQIPNDIISIITDYVIDLCDVDSLQNEDYWDRDDHDDMDIENNINKTINKQDSTLLPSYGASRHHHDLAHLRFAPY